MFTFFKSIFLKGLLKNNTVCIDNNIFRLHYKATVIFLGSFSLLVSLRQYIGDPIKCIVDHIPSEVMNAYCWISSTFTVTNHIGGKPGYNVAYSGVGSHVEEEDEVLHHKYYQWVCFVLIFQAMLFYIPHYLWETWEADRIKSLAFDLEGPIVSKQCREDRQKVLIEYFSANIHTHNFYAYRFFFCEVLNFINVIGQIYFIDYFLGGEFSTYGSDVVRFTLMDPNVRNDPMSRVFPKVTKCTFRNFGPSGTIQKFDGLCVLPLNNLNEKIYVFLWFWFVILSILSGLSLIYRVTVIFGSNIRMHLLRVRSRLSTNKQVKMVIDECHIGDWFILYQLGKNIDPFVYKELICALAENLSRKVYSDSTFPVAKKNQNGILKLHDSLNII